MDEPVPFYACDRLTTRLHDEWRAIRTPGSAVDGDVDHVPALA